MSRQKSLRSFLTICCSLALLLYIAAPVFARAQTQENQPPSAQENSTMHEPPATGTTGKKSQTKSKKTKKSHQSKTNARQKPGTSTGTNPRMNQGANPDMNKGKMQQPDTYGHDNPNSGGAGVNPDKTTR